MIIESEEANVSVEIGGRSCSRVFTNGMAVGTDSNGG